MVISGRKAESHIAFQGRRKREDVAKICGKGLRETANSDGKLEGKRVIG